MRSNCARDASSDDESRDARELPRGREFFGDRTREIQW